MESKVEKDTVEKMHSYDRGWYNFEKIERVYKELLANNIQKINALTVSIKVEVETESGTSTRWETRYIGSLNLSFYNILPSFYSALRQNKSLVNLTLQSHQFMGFNIISLIHHPTLEHLDLANNLLGQGLAQSNDEQSATTWKLFLEKNTHLKTLSLRGNKIHSSSIKIIILGLKKNKSLVKLDLSNNKLKDDCIDSIIEAFEDNRTLEELIIEGNKFTTEGIEKLVIALSTNLNLTKLKVGNPSLNPFKNSRINKEIKKSQLNRHGFSDAAMGLIQIWHEQFNIAIKENYLGHLPEEIIRIIFLKLMMAYFLKFKPEDFVEIFTKYYEEAKLPLFWNQYPDHQLGEPALVSVHEIKEKKLSGTFNYVVMANKELMIGKQLKKGIGSSHIDLAEGRPVLAAGEIEFKKGKLVFYNNKTGHYLCDESAKMFAKTTLKKAGLNVKAKYIESAEVAFTPESKM